MVELDYKYINNLKQKNNIAKRNAIYFNELSLKENNRMWSIRYWKKYNRIMNCLTFWHFDKYEQNKLLDLKKINRCKDIFCPNCRAFSCSTALYNFMPLFDLALYNNSYPFMITLTVPNCDYDDLEGTINKMNKSFKKFWGWLSGRSKFKAPLFLLQGAVKVLEVTVSKNNNTFHPHFHIIGFIKDPIMELFLKDRDGGYQYRTGKNIFYSQADVFIQQAWTMAVKDIDYRILKDMSDNWYDNFICDIRTMDIPKGLYEVFKYSFKDVEIDNIEIIDKLAKGLFNKRMRQGYGIFYNCDMDKDIFKIIKDDDITNYLEFDETPQDLYLRGIDALKDYDDYKKISRYNCDKYSSNIN